MAGEGDRLCADLKFDPVLVIGEMPDNEVSPRLRLLPLKVTNPRVTTLFRIVSLPKQMCLFPKYDASILHHHTLVVLWKHESWLVGINGIRRLYVELRHLLKLLAAGINLFEQ